MTVCPVAKARALLEEVEAPKPLRQRGAWAIDHQRQMAECIRDLLAYIHGSEQASEQLALLASRLLVAVSRLLTNPRSKRDFMDEWVEGTAPDLRAAVRELRTFLERI